MRRHVLLLTVLCILTFFAGLGRGAITDSDEAYYAEAAREMVETGDWITPHYNHAPRLQKPVLMYWLIAACYLLIGVGEFAARLPAALSGLALVLITYACARRWYDDDTAVLSGAIVATSFGYFAMARVSLPDLPLTCFVVLATWAAIETVLHDPIDAPVDRVASRPSAPWLLVSACAAAFACLVKGPVGLLLPAIVIGPLAIWERWSRHPAVRRPLLPAGLDVVTIVMAASVFVLVAAPWYLAVTQVHGPAYLRQFFVGENLVRFATDEFNAPRPVWFYLPILVGGLLPWSPFVALWVPNVARAVRGLSRPTVTEVRLLVWAVAPLLFYTVSVGKQPRYILPVLPPLAILLARSIHQRLRRSATGSQDWLFDAATGVSALMWLIVGVLLVRAAPLLGVAGLPNAGIAGALMVVCAIALVACGVLGGRYLVPRALSVGAAVTVLSLSYGVLAPARPAPVERMSERLLSERQDNEQSGTYAVFVRNLVFYSGIRQRDLITDEQVIAFLQSPARVFCVIAEDQLTRIAPQVGEPLRQLARMPYVNIADVRVGTLLRPSAPGVIETVILVANR